VILPCKILSPDAYQHRRGRCDLLPQTGRPERAGLARQDTRRRRLEPESPPAITHEKRLLDCRADLNAFLTAARALRGKLLCCLLQFGYFNRSAFSSVDHFLERLAPFLDGWPKDVPVAVEIRIKGWIGPKLLDCLRERNAVLTLVDQAWMPSPWSLVQQFDVLTGPFGYVRLLGHREQVGARTNTLDRVVIDRADQIEANALAIGLLSRRASGLAFINNHFAGYAPETARQLREALAKP
jgi:uncharacterized protein YecE (DUF72 family)